MSVGTQIATRLVLYFSGYLGFFYLIWIFRTHDLGRSVTGVIMSIMFGCVLMYLAEAWKHYQKNYKGMALADLGLGGMFGYLWYNALKAINDSIVTGLPCPIAKQVYPGWFGIEGFWGLGVAVPIYFGMMLTVVGIVYLWDWLDPWFNLKWWWRSRQRRNYYGRRHSNEIACHKHIHQRNF